MIKLNIFTTQTQVYTMHLWEIETALFTPSSNDMNIPYTNWKNFQDNTPDSIFKNHIMISWSWIYDTLQIVFSDRIRNSFTYVHITVNRSQEEEIRDWIKKHKPQFWNI